jgi:hypothetical protein
MQPTEEQLTALGNYSDVINQHLPEIAEGIGVPSQTLKGWMEDKGEPTGEQAQKILDFLRDKVGRGPQGLVGMPSLVWMSSELCPVRSTGCSSPQAMAPVTC